MTFLTTGFVHVLNSTRDANDLGHPLFNNLRSGDWMLDYISNRLHNNFGTKKLGIWFQRVFDTLKKVRNRGPVCDEALFDLYCINMVKL